jgi:hypothetical protein
MQKKTQIGVVPVEDFLVTGKLLWELNELDPSKFSSTLRSMGLSQRKGYYLIELYKTYHKLKIPKEVLLRVGWTKLQVIAAVVTPANWPFWIAQAEVLAVHELKDLVQGKPLQLEKHCVLSYLTPAQFELLSIVLVKHGATRDGRSILGKEDALMKALVRLYHLDFGEAELS